MFTMTIISLLKSCAAQQWRVPQHVHVLLTKRAVHCITRLTARTIPAIHSNSAIPPNLNSCTTNAAEKPTLFAFSALREMPRGVVSRVVLSIYISFFDVLSPEAAAVNDSVLCALTCCWYSSLHNVASDVTCKQPTRPEKFRSILGNSIVMNIIVWNCRIGLYGR